MRTVFIVVLSILTVMETFSQNTSTDRQPYAAGKFYPADKTTLNHDLAILFEQCTKSGGDRRVRAIISPHAGYIFSGRTAASAFSSIPKNAEYKNIFIIGSSHVMYFDGASVYNSGDYITPLGKATVNKEIADKIKASDKVFDFPVDAHLKEHSIENQIPFIQHYFSKTPPIIPIIIGTDDNNTVRRIAAALKPWFTPDNLFIISSDFSHYPSYNDAITTDHKTAMSIVSGKPGTFLSTLAGNASKHIPGLATSMCGWTSGLALLYLTENNNNIEYKLVDYSNSGDKPEGGKNEVVGYNAIVAFEKNNHEKGTTGTQSSFKFTAEEKKILFGIVKNSINAKLNGNKTYDIDEATIPASLKELMGAFVTLRIDGALRGCIGRFITSEPLYQVVRESAISAAFEDPRFSPLTREEFSKIRFDITVIGPLRRISNINEIVLGRDGIYIKKDNRAGTMLPQVAVENKWTVEEFLGYTSREKAGLGWDGWRDAEIYVYEGVVLRND